MRALRRALRRAASRRARQRGVTRGGATVAWRTWKVIVGLTHSCRPDASVDARRQRVAAAVHFRQRETVRRRRARSRPPGRSAAPGCGGRPAAPAADRARHRRVDVRGTSRRWPGGQHAARVAQDRRRAGSTCRRLRSCRGRRHDRTGLRRRSQIDPLGTRHRPVGIVDDAVRIDPAPGLGRRVAIARRRTAAGNRRFCAYGVSIDPFPYTSRNRACGQT